MMRGRRPTRRGLAALLILAVPGFSGCRRPLDDAEIRTVMNWLVCEECTAGERDAVVAIGPSVIPFVASILDSVPTIIVEPVRVRSTNSWTPDIHPDRDAHVASRVDAVESLARVRAAQSLGDLHARAALEAGLILARNRAYRDDVIRAIRGAIDASVDDPQLRVDSVRIEPQTVSVPVGGTGQLAVFLEDSIGNLLEETVTWSSSDVAVVSVEAEGRIQGVALGTATITASAGAKTASATVTVTSVAPAAPMVTIADGNHQSAPAGSLLPQVVGVLAVTTAGQTASGLPVEWTVLLGGGSVSQASDTTDSAGIANALWTLGAAGPQRLEVRVGTAPAVVFRATAY